MLQCATSMTEKWKKSPDHSGALFTSLAKPFDCINCEFAISQTLCIRC